MYESAITCAYLRRNCNKEAGVKYLNDNGDVYCVKNKLTTKGSAPRGKLDVEKEHCKSYVNNTQALLSNIKYAI